MFQYKGINKKPTTNHQNKRDPPTLYLGNQMSWSLSFKVLSYLVGCSIKMIYAAFQSKGSRFIRMTVKRWTKKEGRWSVKEGELTSRISSLEEIHFMQSTWNFLNLKFSQWWAWEKIVHNHWCVILCVWFCACNYWRKFPWSDKHAVIELCYVPWIAWNFFFFYLQHGTVFDAEGKE